MQILKENNKIIKYILLIISIPFISVIIKEMIDFLFQVGRYHGTFIRGIYEIVISVL